MWFVLIILVLVGIPLLRGNYSSIHGKVFDNTDNKERYSKVLGKPVLVTGIGIALSGFIAFVRAHGRRKICAPYFYTENVPTAFMGK